VPLRWLQAFGATGYKVLRSTCFQWRDELHELLFDLATVLAVSSA
jgi:hypothetical protein